MSSSSIEPVTLYGASISYFTGKLENYFRIKGIPYQFVPMTSRTLRPLIEQQTGSSQVPAIQLNDGRWMTDSTPIIQWFEDNHPGPPVLPSDPVQRFFSLLLEDYADEWLWRPAMHYRWHYDVGARFASAHLAEELGADAPLPNILKRRAIIRRQRNGYTVGDGITPDQIPAIEAIFLRTLKQLNSIFQDRPFLLGDRPTLADIGFSGPFFRHFALDPIPAEIVRQQAPAVYAWVARLWNSTPASADTTLLAGIPDDWGPLLQEIGSNYLPYLCANTDAVVAGKKTFDSQIDGVTYSAARWSPYRVWCLQQLRSHFTNLDEQNQASAKNLLQQFNCWAPLWQHKKLPIDEKFCADLPFRADAKMIDVYQ